MQPLISIIMPAYNADRYIEGAIESVLAQTYKNWELVVVDDGSTDETADIVRRFAASDARIKYIYQSNQMLAQARNNGIKHSEGSLIAFLDSDDLWLPEKLQLQHKTLTMTRADIIFSDGFIFSDDDVFNETQSFGIIIGEYRGVDMLDLQIIENRIPVLSVLVSRAALDEVGGFDVESKYFGCEDYELWCRMARHGAKFYGMGEHLVRYRVHENALSRLEAKMLSAKLALLEKHRHASRLDEQTIRSRLTMLRKDMISVLLTEGNIVAAQECAAEMAACAPREFKTRAQSFLVRYAPNHYNRIRRYFNLATKILRREPATVFGVRTS